MGPVATVDSEYVRRAVRIAGIISLYWVVSISMVFTNKHLVGGEKSEVDMILFIACYQCFIVVAVIGLMMRFSLWMGWRRRTELISPRLLHRNIVILSLTFVGGLLFNSLMLKHIGVAFYQVARSSTLIFVVILSHFLLGTFINIQIAMCCSVVVMGYYLGASQEGIIGDHFPLRGICYGLAASLVIALGGTFMKKSEDIMNRDSLRLTFAYNFNSIFILVSLLLSTGQFTTVFRSEKMYDPWFWLVLTCSGILSLLIGVASALQIQVTSPTTHHISISAKSVTQTVLAVLYFNQTKTFLWWLGNFLTIFGTVSYAMVKMRAEKFKHRLDFEVRPPAKYQKDIH